MFERSFRILAWIEYLPRGVRRAWCEVTGGHDNSLSCAKGKDQITHVMLTCLRCGKRTEWYATNWLAPRETK
jgi:hypothetical protein